MAEEAGDDDGFYGYVEDTVDPGPWLLLGTTIFCFLVMLLFVPLLVLWKINRRQNTTISIDACDSKKEVLVGPGTNSTSIGSSALKPAPTAKQYTTADTTIKANLSHEESQMFKQIFRCDQESSDILKLAIPLTVTALSSSTFSNICIILVSQFVGTKAVAAFALVQILVGLTDGMLHGPIYACSSLCAHAVGAGNSILAGQYIQLSILIYLLVNIPVICFWWTYMYEAILYLKWRDADTALQAQEFVRIYIWSVILSGVSSSIWQLLEVTGHAVMGTTMCIFWHLSKVALVSVIVTWRDASLWEVGLVYVVTAAFFVGLTWVIATMKGWFKPFTKGMTGTLAFKNTVAVRLLLQQGLPLAMGSLLSNAEWAVLTFFASHLGSAEVTTWAILGSIWDVFYSSTQGIGDAAEIRVAYHLGENQAVMAKISAYKSLLLGMMVASFVSIVYFSLQSQIPLWFSSDETIQAMLAELVPFVGVANLTMTFGMQCWSLIGAQGKYQLATWISFLSSWGITMPMAAIFVFWLRIDLQGLTSAVVIGYVATGASLSYVLLSSDWDEVAKEIEQQNREPESTTKSERLYASMKKTKSSATKATVRRNVMLLTVPAGRKSGILLGKVYDKPGKHILLVRHWSPLFGKVKPGDIVLALDGLDVSSESAEEIATRLRSKRSFDRQLVIRPPPTHEGHRMADLNAIAVTESQSFENMSCSSV